VFVRKEGKKEDDPAGPGVLSLTLNERSKKPD